MGLILSYASLEALRDEWTTESDLPFRLIAIAGGPDRFIVRLVASESDEAKNFLAARDIVVDGHPASFRVAIHDGSEPDETLAPLRAQLVGLDVQAARGAVPSSWDVCVIDSQRAAGQLSRVVDTADRTKQNQPSSGNAWRRSKHCFANSATALDSYLLQQTPKDFRPTTGNDRLRSFVKPPPVNEIAVTGQP